MLSDLESGNQEGYSSSLDATILDQLNSIVHFLHAEGLYASEEALLREIEERFNLDKEDELQAQNPAEIFKPDKKICAEGTINFQPNVQETQAQDGLESAEKCVYVDVAKFSVDASLLTRSYAIPTVYGYLYAD